MIRMELRQLLTRPRTWVSMLLLVGLMMFSTGLIGELVMRTYFESQNRRIYAVRDILTHHENVTGPRA